MAFAIGTTIIACACLKMSHAAIGINPSWPGGFEKRGETVTTSSGVQYSLLGVGYCRGGPPGGKIAVGLVSYVRKDGTGAPQSGPCMEACGQLPRCVGVELRNSDNWCEMQVPDLERAGDGSDKTNTDWYSGAHAALASSLTSGYNSINAVINSPTALTTANPQAGFYCWRKVNDCSSTTDSKCESLNRYTCLEGGRTPNMCGPCAPLHVTTDGSLSWHDGMTACVPDSTLILPTFRVALGSPWFGGQMHDETLYLAMIYGVAKAWTDNQDESLIPIPLSKRMAFPINITGHTEEWNNIHTSPSLESIYGSSAPNLDQRIENHPMSGVRAMTCLKSDAISDHFDLMEPADSVRSRPHVVIGSTSDNSVSGLMTHSITDLPLSHAATFYETPVLGWWFKQKDFADKSLHAYYLRVNSIGMKYPDAAVKLLDHFGYKRFALITSGVSRGFVRDVKNLASKDSEILVENMDLPNPCGDKVFLASCHSSILHAMNRLKAQDARIILHEQDGATQLDMYWASFTGLLRSDTLYIQINALGDCAFPLLPPADGSINGDILWSNIYQGAGGNNRGEWDKMTISKCTVCPNFAFQELAPATRSNKTKVAEYNAAKTSGIYAWSMICPAADSMASILDCTWCDTHSAFWVNPSCAPEIEVMQRDLKGSMCIGLAKDNDDIRTNAWFDYLSSLSAVDLVALGAPKSFFDIFEDPHPLFKSTGVSLRALWEGKWKALFKERAALMDALLLSLVAYNEWIRASGDSTPALSSTQLRTGYRTIASTPIPNWMATLKGSSFTGLTGPVSFNAQGERNVDYMVYSASGSTLAFTPVFRLNQVGVLVPLVSNITYNDGTTVAPLDREPPCLPGFHYVVEQRGCVICPKGKTCVGARFPAIPCAPGTAAPSEGLTQCIDCPIGTTSENGTTCVACDAGFGAPAEAMADCTPCPAGTSWRTKSAPAGIDSRLKIVEVAVCEMCSIGEYAKRGDLTCTQCGAPNTTTRFKGSTRHEQCVCKPGFYRPCNGETAACPKDNYLESQARPCLPCPDGMKCPIGSDMVNLKIGASENYAKATPGYMTLAADPVFVYKCKPANACPGGDPDTCAGGRTSFSCGTCPDDLSLIRGSCIECSGAAWAGFVVYMVCIPIALLTLYLTSGSAHAWRGNPGGSLSMAMRMSLRFVQILAVFSLSTVNWPYPLDSVVQAVTLMDFALPFKCIAKSNVIATYLGGMLTLPVAFVWMLIMFLMLQKTSSPWSVNSVMCAWGKACSTLFVSQVTLCMRPFMCYAHPSGNRSVLNYTATLCGSGDHIYMVIVASVCLMIAVAFVAFCAYKTYRMAHIVNAADAHAQLERILFLVDDFRTGMISTFLMIQLQDFLIALTMVIAPDDTHLQLMYFFCIMLLATVCTGVWFPWKFPYHNLMTVLFQCATLVLLLVGKDYTIDVGNDYRNSVPHVLVVGFVLSVSFVVLILVPLLNRIMRGQRGELFFITNLGSYPSEENISQLWGSVTNLSAEYMRGAIETWQIYDVLVFRQTLEALSAKRASLAGDDN